MVINTKELIDGIAILTDDRNMRVTIKHSAKGALVCGASCFVGGILLGPVGMAVGGTVGAVSAWKMSSGQFKSVGEILKNDLTDRQKEQLVEHIIASVRGFEVTDVVVLLPLLMNNASIQTDVLNTVVSFIGKEMRLQLVD